MYKNYINKPDIPNRYVYKILLIMRLTTVILIASILQVSASSFAQKFSYVKKDVPLSQIFKEIKRQTGYTTIWNSKVDVSLTVDANFKQSAIEEVLRACLNKYALTYKIENKTISIKPRELSLKDKIINFFNVIDVRGRVVDESNQPLVGAVVKVKGTNMATSTNSKGEFSLTNVDDRAILVISFLGYEPQEITVTKNMGEVRLVMSVDGLKEVEINAGYYTVTDRERTGSISRITSKEIEIQPVNNLLIAAQGRIPGLQIIQQTGVPGGGFTIQIRGQNSINSGNDPLYVIDGVINPSSRISSSVANGGSVLGQAGASTLSNINPNDIESIEVLKDADATAIYGSRGANGVVLITTKKGATARTTINASYVQGYNKVGHKLDLLNTEQYIAMRMEAFNNDGLKPATADYDVNGTWDQTKYTDWQEVFIGGTGVSRNASLNINGGTDKGNYLIAGDYYKEGTVFPGDYGFQRANVRSNLNIGSVKDRFHASITATFSNIQQDLLYTDLTRSIFLAPNAPDLYDENGMLNYANGTLSPNPFALLYQNNDSSMKNLIGNVNLSYRIIKDLILKTSVGYAYTLRNEFLKFPLISQNPALGPTSADRVSRFSDNYNNSLLVEPQLTYTTNLGKHTISALFGMSFQKENSQIRMIEASDYTSDELMNNIAAAATLTNKQLQYVEYKYAAAFARLNYSFANKYFVNLTARRDGSSRFGSDKQFANFGAVGAAWIFSDEDFLKDKLVFLNFGKLRMSYGVTGNDQIGNYGYVQLWNASTTYQGKTTITPGAAANPDFSWETNKKAEVAIQLGFFNEKINLEVSYFNNRSSNQLLNYSLPLSTGAGAIFYNSPAKVQNTGVEFQVNSRIISTKDWQWSSSLNFSVPRNKLLAYPDLEKSQDAINYKIGEPLSIVKLYNVTVNKQTGLYSIEDKNGSSSVDNGDRYLIKFLGQTFYGGLQNSVQFKQFNLDFHFYFTKQNGRDYKISNAMNPGRWLPLNQITNQVTAVLQRWQQVGDEANVQRFGTTSTTSTASSISRQNGSLSYVDASFIRLKNVSFSYSLPKEWASKIKLHNASIILQGQNLFTITNYTGFDPETQDIGTLPPLRTLSLGLNLTF